MRKNRIIKFRANDEEVLDLKLRSHKLGISISDLIRQKLFAIDDEESNHDYQTLPTKEKC